MARVGRLNANMGILPNFRLINERIHPPRLKATNYTDYLYAQNPNVPLARSGHRTYTDNDYFYVLGGYRVEGEEGEILQEFWAYNIMTKQWRSYQIDEDFPIHLASFSIVQTAPYSKQIILFGGSGSTFGRTSSDKTYLITPDNDHCRVRTQIIEPRGDKISAKYGHSMVASNRPHEYFIIGGTVGSTFLMHIHTLTFKRTNEEPEGFWERKELTKGINRLVGRYRLESVYDEVNKTLLFFGGGGRNNKVWSMKYIQRFNVRTFEYSLIETKPVDEKFWPEPRKCFALVRYGRNVIISGGEPKRERGRTPLRDIWIYNLDSNQWTKFHSEMRKSLKFHDMSITSDGVLMFFGGLNQYNRRTNELVLCQVFSPSLKRLAAHAVRLNFPKLLEGIDGGNLKHTTDVPEIYLRLTNAEYFEQKWNEQNENFSFLPRIVLPGGKCYYDSSSTEVIKMEDNIIIYRRFLARDKPFDPCQEFYENHPEIFNGTELKIYKSNEIEIFVTQVALNYDEVHPAAPSPPEQPRWNPPGRWGPPPGWRMRDIDRPRVQVQIRRDIFENIRRGQGLNDEQIARMEARYLEILAEHRRMRRAEINRRRAAQRNPNNERVNDDGGNDNDANNDLGAPPVDEFDDIRAALVADILAPVDPAEIADVMEGLERDIALNNDLQALDERNQDDRNPNDDEGGDLNFIGRIIPVMPDEVIEEDQIN